MHREQWATSEKAIARQAFEQAYKRECAALMEKVRRRARGIAEPNDIWRLHDFLTKQRQSIDEKYDYRYSVLLMVFARLIAEGWLEEDELAGLSEDKLDRIRFIAGLANR